MFDYFGFDPRTLSDEELTSKLAELQSKMAYASRFSSPGLLESMQHIMSSLEFEQRERIVRRTQEAIDKMTPDVIESDPDLAQKKPGLDTGGGGKIKPQARPRMTITRTNRPADPDQKPESDR